MAAYQYHGTDSMEARATKTKEETGAAFTLCLDEADEEPFSLVPAASILGVS